MAIYQFYLAIIPKNGVEIKHGIIPNKITVSIETGYFEANTEQYWQLSKNTYHEIVEEIDKIISRANWGNDNFNYNWKDYSEFLDNDAYLGVNKETGNIEELSFRADLREENLKFLHRMIELGKINNWLFMDIKGTLISPNIEEVIELIKVSNNHRFMLNPNRFLDDLINGKLQMED
jgi:hypothetical protein